MDARSLALLEFPLVRARLAAATAFEPGRRLAAALEPSPDPVIVGRGLDETDETRALLSERPSVGVGGARDIGPAVDRALRGGRLEAGQFVEIAATLEAADRLVEALREERRPLLRELARSLHGLPGLRSTLERSFDPTGELLDSASPRLGALRRAVRVAYERLRSRLDALVHSNELGGVLQDPIVTLRNGRYVIPVRVEARGKVKGIVHDASGSGATLFVEPLIAVELGNAWREAQVAEAAEIDRILDELSAQVAAQGPQLRETLESMARFDFWSAKARLAAEMDGSRPADAPDGRIELRGARHPGLTGHVVPIDVALGGTVHALVITGPNTGGKTVTLRTLGLLSLMHQAGLHVPADPGSRLPILTDVLADIGDEQSIAQSLSTFSGHLRAIVRIENAAGPGTLVLLDELGAGTDPTEGSALAQALLDRFVGKGALVAATTHYAELKVYAHTTPGVRNASVEFDLESLSPTYRLTIGLPGTSQAFAIAERLGLPAQIVADARSRLTENERAFEATLASIRATEGATSEALAAAHLAEGRAREALRAADEERRRARRERDELIRNSRAEATGLVAGLREEVAALRRTVERETITAPALDSLLARAEAQLSRMPEPEPSDRAERPTVPIRWRVGSRARSRTGGWEGRIAALDRGGQRATVEVGGLRVSVGLDDLEPTTNAPARPGFAGVDGSDGSGPAGALGLARVRSVASSLDLRGARVEEAIELLGGYLDDASLAGLDRVVIVHGVGTGALRDAVRRALTGHPLVRSSRAGNRAEGGDGATIVDL